MIAATDPPTPILHEMPPQTAQPAPAQIPEPSPAATPTPTPALESVAGGIVVVGLDQPQALLDSLGPDDPDPAAYLSPVFVLEPEESLAAHPLAERIIAHPRATLFVGPACHESFAAHLRQSLASAPPARLNTTSARTAGLAQAVADTIRKIIAEHNTATAQTRARLETLGRQRAHAYWQQRFDEIHQGAAPRILVVTSLYTTFLRYSAEDIAQAFRDQGADARLLIQPDNKSVITPLAVMQEIERFDPDLTVVINYTRQQRAEMFPIGRPFVCWVQDAMNHMFQGAAENPTDLDFIAGHIYPDSALIRGYADNAVLRFPVPVSDRKFNPAPITPEDQRRFACDIAYVSHQSEPAERFHDRLSQEFPPAQRPALARCFAQVRSAIEHWSEAPQELELENAAESLAAELGRAGDATTTNILRTQYVFPIAERLLRHQTLEWAAEIASKHSLSLRIYGNGWQQHPTLHPYAHDAVQHGEPLRACYQAAAVHLHASALGSGHQRVIECACSGGLPLCRRSWDEQHRHDWIRMTEFMQSGIKPDATLVRWKAPAYAIDNHPALASIISDRARMPRPVGGWNHEPFTDVYAQIEDDPYFQYWQGPLPPAHERSLSIFEDPLELTFSTRDELEQRITRAAADPHWKKQKSDSIAKAARESKSMHLFAKTLLAFVTEKVRNAGQGGRAHAEAQPRG